MKITLEREEVMEIVKAHVSNLLPEAVEGKDVAVLGTSYGEWEVKITEKESEAS